MQGIKIPFGGMNPQQLEMMAELKDEAWKQSARFFLDWEAGAHFLFELSHKKIMGRSS